MNITKIKELINGLYEGQLEFTVETKTQLDELLVEPPNLVIEEHNAKGAAEMIAHLAKTTAVGHPPMAIDAWIKKVDLYAKALLDGSELPDLSNVSDDQMFKIACAAAEGKFKHAPNDFNMNSLVTVVCSWLKEPWIESMTVVTGTAIEWPTLNLSKVAEIVKGLDQDSPE